MGENMNILSLSVDEAVLDLSNLYINLINNNIPLGTIPSPFLWGPPGVGKSDAVREIGKKIEEKTAKKVNVTDVRLLLFSPVDLRGVPVADERREFTNWLMPRIFDMDSSKDIVNILFLDELSAAPASVQAAAYQITLNKTIGEHRLPDNVIVMAAGNRLSDRSVAFRMPNALANRLMHIEIEVSFESFNHWAVNNNINPYVLGYLSFDRSKLMSQDLSLDDLAFATPRSWNFVSNIMNGAENGIDLDSLYHLISACVGTGNAMEFLAFCKVYKELPEIKDVLLGDMSIYPKTNDALYAFIASASTYIIKHSNNNDKNRISLTELDNLCEYAERFPADFAALLYKNLSASEEINKLLLKSHAYKNWCVKNRKLLLGTK